MQKRKMGSVFKKLYLLFIAIMAIIYLCVIVIFLTYAAAQRRLELEVIQNSVGQSASVMKQQLDIVADMMKMLVSDNRTEELSRDWDLDSYAKSQRVLGLIGAHSLTFGQLLQEFKRICDQSVWLDEEELAIKGLEREDMARDSLPEYRKQELLQKVWKLEYCLEGMEEENTLLMLKELQSDLQGIRSMHDLFALEVYCTVSARLIGWIKRLGIHEELALRVGTMNLYNVSLHENWQDAFGYLKHVAENIFELRSQNTERHADDVVNQVKQYILEHLAEDTSLYTLAEQVHFSQEYLLRIFKKKEGITILQYINDLKLSAAKRLLAETELSVKEIAEQLGFASQGYFGRFFRSKTGLTPNAYRDAQKRAV